MFLLVAHLRGETSERDRRDIAEREGGREEREGESKLANAGRLMATRVGSEGTGSTDIPS